MTLALAKKLLSRRRLSLALRLVLSLQDTLQGHRVARALAQYCRITLAKAL